MFFCTRYIAPIVAVLSVLQEEAVLHVAHVVGLSHVPVRVVQAVGTTGVRPHEIPFRSLVISARVPAMLTGYGVCYSTIKMSDTNRNLLLIHQFHFTRI
ncbi:hypothetical protein DPMN_118078 [Dreissena polymorpha]|uniref:Uncharacterized protein n=1 Tax=Dreissena polymorpha TaxID=45954 RepID=A0A9D4JLJ0_DREPO|nr:hypothetical protein DPMN_118078 [Dreissena polymorpha]